MIQKNPEANWEEATEEVEPEQSPEEILTVLQNAIKKGLQTKLSLMPITEKYVDVNIIVPMEIKGKYLFFMSEGIATSVKIEEIIGAQIVEKEKN